MNAQLLRHTDRIEYTLAFKEDAVDAFEVEALSLREEEINRCSKSLVRFCSTNA
jgi:hypothetical protein